MRQHHKTITLGRNTLVLVGNSANSVEHIKLHGPDKTQFDLYTGILRRKQAKRRGLIVHTGHWNGVFLARLDAKWWN